MTQPDGSIPGGAVNYDSLARFASMTEADWDAAIRAQALATWGEQGLLGKLFGGLREGQSFVMAVFEGLAGSLGLQGAWDTTEEILQAIGGALGEVGGAALDELKATVAALTDRVNNVWNDLLNELTGTPTGGLQKLTEMLRQALFGQIAPERIPVVPVNSIGAAVRNLLDAPTFTGSRSVDGKGLWFYDATTGRTRPGSTYTDLDGVNQRTLWSNEIYVAAGDVLDMDIYTRRENYVGPAAAIGIDLVLFDGADPAANLVGVVLIANSGRTTTTSLDWDENLKGSYTVPAAAPPTGRAVDRVRLQLRVAATATAGRVRFDDGTLTKRGTKLPQDLVDHLPEDIRDIIQGIGSGATGIIKDLDQFTLQNFRETVNNLLRGVTDANAAIAELLSRVSSAGAQGTMIVVKFGDYPDGAVPAEFREIYSSGQGGVGVRNGCLDWIDSGNQQAVRLYLYGAATLATDAFEVAFAMPRRPENHIIGISRPCFNYLIGGATADGSEFVVARIGYGTVRFGKGSGGSITWFGSDYLFQTPAGSSVRFRGETIDGTVNLQLYVNAHEVTRHIDSAGTITLDATRRSCGVGFHADNRALGQNTPGSMSMFLMNDALASGPPLVI